ncbi:hypothetical protein AWH56_011395 [Anaerobacillus isosaccharinicus]|uniref:Tissue inhibitor of metalloproteinase n=1 Tax=Anaerobacillus isosaccharinicus TaxID=1532552 RepID=A0A1S2M8L7_9BACI|nr:hypothetical protein [Anaerobacillus isosaccharinicus]MBA5588493.1 hypothetical protein [Anaerobacillus isosaccharinicus]QOY38082.1 hypothetical protein AWH56_011395 [Anaerobacillus isosaccharinicus]
MVNKREKLLLFFSSLTLLTLVFFYQPALTSACNCDVPDNATEALDKANAVFKGKVIKLKEETIDGEKYDVALISVSETWKGIKNSQVKVYTDWTSCQFELEEEKEYLLFPYKYHDRLIVINCGRSTEIKYAQEDLLELGEGNEPTIKVQLEDDFKNGKSVIKISFALLLIINLVLIFLRKKS